MKAKANILKALGDRVGQEAVHRMAHHAALQVLKDGGGEVDAVLAASMSFFRSVTETCQDGKAEESGEGSTTHLILPHEGDAMNFFTVIADQVRLPSVHGVLLFALIQAAGGDWTRRITDEKLFEVAQEYAEMLGVPELKHTLKTNLDTGGGEDYGLPA